MATNWIFAVSYVTIALDKISENPVFSRLLNFCPIITQSSILLTIPVAFINKIPPFYFLSFIFFVARKCSICKTEEFILKVTFKVNMRL